jgi:hypothetical protein
MAKNNCDGHTTACQCYAGRVTPMYKGKFISVEHEICMWRQVADNDLEKRQQGKKNITLEIMLNEYIKIPRAQESPNA